MLDTPVPIRLLNTEVKQHWVWIILGWETLQEISVSAAPPPCGQSTVLPDLPALTIFVKSIRCLFEKYSIVNKIQWPSTYHSKKLAPSSIAIKITINSKQTSFYPGKGSAI